MASYTSAHVSILALVESYGDRIAFVSNQSFRDYRFERAMSRLERSADDLSRASRQANAQRLWRQKCEVCYLRGRNPSIGMPYLRHWNAPRRPMTAQSHTQRRHNKRRAWVRSFARRTRPT
jgi:hypothetical protein